MRRATDPRALLFLILAGCPEKPIIPPPPPPPPRVVEAPVVIDAGPPPAAADEKGPAVVMSVAGEVQVRRQGSEEWIALSVGDAIRVGDRVRTSGDGQLALSFDV